MPFTKIVPADLQGKGVIGQPAVPGLSVSEMQESVEQVVREVAIPAVNRLIDELEATSAAGNIGMELPSGMAPETPENVQGVVQSHVENVENPHGVTAEQVGAYTKAETDQAIDEKVQAIGAADMSKAEFATNGRYGVVDIAQASETAGEADDGVKVYTHAKSGTVHEFTGNGPNGRALMTADVEAGDTFTVNGEPVVAYMGAEDAVESMAGNAWNGKWVSFVFDGTAINFKGGGGLSAADKALLIPENIRAGVTIAKVIGSLIPSTQENSLACVWTRVYDNGNAPIQSNNVTDEAPISVSGTKITVKRNFTAFVQKFPFKNANGSNGSSNIPEGQVSFEQGQTYSVSVSVPHGNNNMSGIMLLLVVNG